MSAGGDGCPNAIRAGANNAQLRTFSPVSLAYELWATPPWNVAGVDYPVGTHGTLKDPGPTGAAIEGRFALRQRYGSDVHR